MVQTLEEVRLVLRSEIDRAAQKWKRGQKTVETANVKTSKSLALLTKGLGAFGLAIGAAGAVRGLVRFADSATRLQNQLRLVTDGAAGLAKTTRALTKLSLDSGTALETNATLYARLARSTEELGFGQSDLLKITETLSKAVIVGGSSAEQASGALLQLSQAFASGALRGDEFNSVSENLSVVLPFIARELGVQRSELRELAAQGLITADVLGRALLTANREVREEFGKTNKTIGQGATSLGTGFTRLVGSVDDLLGTSRVAGASLGFLGNTFATLAEAIQGTREESEGLNTALQKTIDLSKLSRDRREFEEARQRPGGGSVNIRAERAARRREGLARFSEFAPGFVAGPTQQTAAQRRAAFFANSPQFGPERPTDGLFLDDNAGIPGLFDTDITATLNDITAETEEIRDNSDDIRRRWKEIRDNFDDAGRGADAFAQGIRGVINPLTQLIDGSRSVRSIWADIVGNVLAATVTGFANGSISFGGGGGGGGGSTPTGSFGGNQGGANSGLPNPAALAFAAPSPPPTAQATGGGNTTFNIFGVTDARATRRALRHDRIDQQRALSRAR